ncbi:MAG: hypothetical protein JWN75_1163 [Candidatus Saccharibacteria bacterium]|nr:hypothetical protein [Candidatus Saccharibacteria bacterium]
MRAGLPGQIADMNGYDADTRIVESAGGIPFGVVCGQGAADKGAVIGGANPVGISIRDITLIHDTANLDRFVQKENVALLKRGTIWVIVGGTVTPTSVVSYNLATGIVSAAADDGSNDLLPGAKFLTSATVGQIAQLRVLMP